jgi:hypothetical protein
LELEVYTASELIWIKKFIWNKLPITYVSGDKSIHEELLQVFKNRITIDSKHMAGEGRGGNST